MISSGGGAAQCPGSRRAWARDPAALASGPKDRRNPTLVRRIRQCPAQRWRMCGRSGYWLSAAPPGRALRHERGRGSGQRGEEEVGVDEFDFPFAIDEGRRRGRSFSSKSSVCANAATLRAASYWAPEWAHRWAQFRSGNPERTFRSNLKFWAPASRGGVGCGTPGAVGVSVSRLLRRGRLWLRCVGVR